MARDIRLRSSGLLVFGGRVISAFTGLLFTVMVARWLSPPQVGLWEVIVDLVTFSAFPVGFVAYWATRDIARGKMVGRTAMVVGIAMSGGGLGLYSVFTFFTYSSLAASILPFVLGALLVPLSYWSAVANSILQGHRPGMYGYSLVISELAKLAVAYEALYVLKLNIMGVILALLASYLVQSAVSTYFVKDTMVDKYQGAQAIFWLGRGWLPALSYLPTVFAVADTYVASLVFGAGITGYYQIPFIVGSVVGYSSALAFSLYPLLLRGGGERLPAVTIEFALLFSIPMAVGGIVLAGPILQLFGKTYVAGALGLEILCATFVVLTLSGILDQTLLGTERADVDVKATFRSLVRSNLVFVPVVNIVGAVVYIGGMVLALSYSFANSYPTSTTVGLWTLAQLLAAVTFMLVKISRARRSAHLKPGANVVYYLASAAVMGLVVYFLSGRTLSTGADALVYGVQLLGLVVAGTLVYFVLVFVLDKKFRDLARRMIR